MNNLKYIELLETENKELKEKIERLKAEYETQTGAKAYNTIKRIIKLELIDREIINE